MLGACAKSKNMPCSLCSLVARTCPDQLVQISLRFNLIRKSIRSFSIWKVKARWVDLRDICRGGNSENLNWLVWGLTASAGL